MNGGVLGELVSGERRILERGVDGRPLRVLIDATDEFGRKLLAEGRCRNWLKWPAYVDMFTWWSLAEWEFDGEKGWGEEAETLGFRLLRRLQHSRLGSSVPSG
jgi:hypothetical protein